MTQITRKTHTMSAPLTTYTPQPPTLSDSDQAALTDLYVRGTPANTLRAYARDLIYITAWAGAAFWQDLTGARFSPELVWLSGTDLNLCGLMGRT